MSSKKKLINIFYLLVIGFLIYSMMGWIYEVIICLVNDGEFVNRGFLLGPYLPVYGFGGLLLVYSLKKLKDKKIKVFKLNITPIIVFVLIVILTSVLEYLTSYFMELIYNDRWWDYSNWSININGRVALIPSLRFGVLGLLGIYLFQPIIEKTSKKVSDKIKIIITSSILVIIILDFITTVIRMAS